MARSRILLFRAISTLLSRTLPLGATYSRDQEICERWKFSMVFAKQWNITWLAHRSEVQALWEFKNTDTCLKSCIRFHLYLIALKTIQAYSIFQLSKNLKIYITVQSHIFVHLEPFQVLLFFMSKRVCSPWCTCPRHCARRVNSVQAKGIFTWSPLHASRSPMRLYKIRRRYFTETHNEQNNLRYNNCLISVNQ